MLLSSRQIKRRQRWPSEHWLMIPYKTLRLMQPVTSSLRCKLSVQHPQICGYFAIGTGQSGCTCLVKSSTAKVTMPISCGTLEMMWPYLGPGKSWLHSGSVSCYHFVYDMEIWLESFCSGPYLHANSYMLKLCCIIQDSCKWLNAAEL